MLFIRTRTWPSSYEYSSVWKLSSQLSFFSVVLFGQYSLLNNAPRNRALSIWNIWLWKLRCMVWTRLAGEVIAGMVLSNTYFYLRRHGLGQKTLAKRPWLYCCLFLPSLVFPVWCMGGHSCGQKARRRCIFFLWSFQNWLKHTHIYRSCLTLNAFIRRYVWR